MKNISGTFIRIAVLFGLIGMALGLIMAISGDHTQRPAHAHINLIGWASMMLFGLFYRSHPEAGRSRLAAAHLWSSGIGVVVMNAGLIALYGGHPGAEPAAAIGSILVILGMILFALVAFRTTGPAGDR